MDATHAAPKRAGVYCRLSYAPDGSLEKVERQEGDCRELGARLRWPVSDAHVYVDNSRSAWQRNRRRPAWDRMLQDVEDGEIDALLIYHGDRLIRQPFDLERLLGVADSKSVRLASPSGTRNLDNPDDRYILRIEAAGACRESDNTSRRIQRHIKARVARGQTQRGGNRPFGYGVQTGTKIRTNARTGERTEVPVYDTDQLVEAEAEYLREAADRLLAGQSQNGVLAWLWAEGVTSTKGARMTARGLGHLMLAPRTAGLIRYKGELYEAAWPAILSRETWEDVGALYQRNREEHPYQGRARVHLLSGIAQCYSCESTVTTKPVGGRNRKNARIYYCGGCRAVGRSLAHLDAYVQGRTVRLLSDKRFIKELTVVTDRPDIAREIAELDRRKAATQQQLNQLADHPDVDVTAALLGLASFDARAAQLREQLATTARQRLLVRMAGISREAWEEQPVDIRAATISALWTIVILPATHRGPGFSPDSVRMERRRSEAGVRADRAEA